VPGADIPWTEPRDLTIDEIIKRIRSNNRRGHPGGVNVAFCDGHVNFIRENVSPEVLRALADPENKGQVDLSEF